MIKSPMEDRIDQQIEVSNWWYINRETSHALGWHIHDQVNRPVSRQAWQAVCAQILQDLGDQHAN